TARTAPTCRRSTPLWTGKCTLRPSTLTSGVAAVGTGSGCIAGASGRRIPPASDVMALAHGPQSRVFSPAALEGVPASRREGTGCWLGQQQWRLAGYRAQPLIGGVAARQGGEQGARVGVLRVVE